MPINGFDSLPKTKNISMDVVSVSDWKDTLVSLSSSGVKKLERRQAFDFVQAVFRAGIFEKEKAIGKSFEVLLERINKGEIKLTQTIENFLKFLRLKKLQSIGIHIVDPIEGRISTIWQRPILDFQMNEQNELIKLEFYSKAWNRLYRRIFRPNATLINAIESGFLPWQWNAIYLTAKQTYNGKKIISNIFFRDTTELAHEFYEILCKHINKDSYNREQNSSSYVESIYQRVWVDLEKESFINRLNRIALRFRDEVIDKQKVKEDFFSYLKYCSGNQKLPSGIESNWDLMLDAIEAVQSSFLSQPAFCDETGLWIHRVQFLGGTPMNQSCIYFIFGQTVKTDVFKNDDQNCIKASIDNLGKSFEDIISNNVVDYTNSSQLSKLLIEKIKTNNTKATYHDGLGRWLYVVEKIARGARHEGNPIRYNIGYGSLAYAQIHLHRYETAPDDLMGHNVEVEKITSYIKGFYSIFGNRDDRWLWFNEAGQYRGVFTRLNGFFDKAYSSCNSQSQHQDTVLFAKINGSGFFDVFYRDGNQIARVRNSEFVDMATEDKKRNQALDLLLDTKNAIPADYKHIFKWLISESIEILQLKTHGTSFVISFEPEQRTQRSKSKWRSNIEVQVKTLVRSFSQFDAPIASFDQLRKYAMEWREKKNYKMPNHIFDFIGEIGNLDGGLWLSLSKKNGLIIRAAQQFIPLLRLAKGKKVLPIDLQMNLALLGEEDSHEALLPSDSVDEIKDLDSLKSFFSAINGSLPDLSCSEKSKYIRALSFLHHSGTKTHSLWGLSLTAIESCICVVISTDGGVFVFRDGRELTGIF